MFSNKCLKKWYPLPADPFERSGSAAVFDFNCLFKRRTRAGECPVYTTYAGAPANAPRKIVSASGWMFDGRRDCTMNALISPSAHEISSMTDRVIERLRPAA